MGWVAPMRRLAVLVAVPAGVLLGLRISDRGWSLSRDLRLGFGSFRCPAAPGRTRDDPYGPSGLLGSKDAERDALGFLAAHDFPEPKPSVEQIEGMQYFASHLRPGAGFDALVCDFSGRPSWPSVPSLRRFERPDEPPSGVEQLGFGLRGFTAYAMYMRDPFCTGRIIGYR